MSLTDSLMSSLRSKGRVKKSLHLRQYLLGLTSLMYSGSEDVGDEGGGVKQLLQKSN